MDVSHPDMNIHCVDVKNCLVTYVQMNVRLLQPLPRKSPRIVKPLKMLCLQKTSSFSTIRSTCGTHCSTRFVLYAKMDDHSISVINWSRLLVKVSMERHLAALDDFSGR